MPVSPFEVLAEPNRRRILDLLQASESPVGDLVERLDLSQPAVSKHLRVLRDAGLVEVRTDAQRRLYRVRPEPLRMLDEWLAPYRRMWASSLDDLEQHWTRLPALPNAKREDVMYGSLEELDDGRYRLRFTRSLAHPQETVWRAITE